MNLLRKLFGGGTAASRPAIEEVDAATARQWHERGDCVLIDVREDREFRAEHIPGARPAPLSRLEQSLPPVSGKKVVFLCQSGMRTRMQAGRLASSCASGEAYTLRGGMTGWKASGFPVERG